MMDCHFFELGFDKYRFDLPLELSIFPIAVRKAIANGFQAAEIQQVSRRRPTLYEKKLMTLKSRAYVKGLSVSVSAQDLENELLKTHYCCPVSQERFTFSGGLLTDWSIDRIDNNQGYETDNIVVVSVKVNQAKSDLNLDEMIAVCFKTYPNYRDLDELEWFRMVSFYYNKMTLTGDLSFTQLLDKKKGRLAYFVFLQLAYVKDSSSKRFLSVLKNMTEKKEFNALVKLARKRVAKTQDHSKDVLDRSPKLCQALEPVVKQVRRDGERFNHYLLDCMWR